MRDLLTKILTGSMIAGAALLVQAGEPEPNHKERGKRKAKGANQEGKSNG